MSRWRCLVLLLALHLGTVARAAELRVFCDGPV
jgi:hypothetical protein